MLVGIVIVVPCVPGMTTSTDGVVLISVVGKGGDVGSVTPAGTTLVEGLVRFVVVRLMWRF
jgi:hypothetical protein